MLADETFLTVTPTGEMSSVYRRVVKILTPAGRDHAYGVAAFDKNTKLRGLRGWSIDASGKIQTLKERHAVETTAGDYEVYTDAKMKFLEALDQFAADHQGAPAPLVICGDLNVARTDMDVHPKERKPRAIGQLPEERALLERLISRDLVDVGRALDPDNDQYFTWWAPWRDMRKRNIGWRLDYVLASTSLFAKVRGSHVQREFGTSDHGPVVAEFEL